MGWPRQGRGGTRPRSPRRRPGGLTSTSGTEHLQGDRPKLVVAEVVGEPLIADDPSAPELVEMVDELSSTAPGGRDQQTDREGPTGDRRHLGEAAERRQGVGPVGRPAPPASWRERRLPSKRRPGSKHFDDEEGLPSAQSRAASSGSISSALRSRAASVAVVASSSGSRHGGHGLSWPKASMSPTRDDALGSPRSGRYRR